MGRVGRGMKISVRNAARRKLHLLSLRLHLLQRNLRMTNNIKRNVQNVKGKDFIRETRSSVTINAGKMRSWNQLLRRKILPKMFQLRIRVEENVEEAQEEVEEEVED